MVTAEIIKVQEVTELLKVKEALPKVKELQEVKEPPKVEELLEVKGLLADIVLSEARETNKDKDLENKKVRVFFPTKYYVERFIPCFLL